MFFFFFGLFSLYLMATFPDASELLNQTLVFGLNESKQHTISQKFDGISKAPENIWIFWRLI